MEEGKPRYFRSPVILTYPNGVGLLACLLAVWGVEPPKLSASSSPSKKPEQKAHAGALWVACKIRAIGFNGSMDSTSEYSPP